ncbi:hypothetical protein BpHYR1_028951 [Brachionus plicatilis]|uniref:Uncharacterized protein n=1 Tax=Brachionus plicatilis TaxID=10195 RepID=A0A3M7PRB5_BRAPC|nr:hypothetical protein BpHYR1_028951 [Brachionus plicatilis]
MLVNHTVYPCSEMRALKPEYQMDKSFILYYLKLPVAEFRLVTKRNLFINMSNNHENYQIKDSELNLIHDN